MEIHHVPVLPVAQQQGLQFDNKQTQVIKSPDISQLNVGDDQAGLHKVEAYDAQALLNERILASLNKSLALDGETPVEKLIPEDYSPEKVADRILSFVRLSMTMFASKGDDDKALMHKFDQALEGIERGFSEAREILEGLGVLNGAIKEGVDNTYALITQGMEKLYESLQGD